MKIKLTASLLALSLLSNLSIAQLRVPAFNARYSLFAKGISVGQGTIILVEPKNNQYSITTTAVPAGLASIFVSEDFSESSTGTIKENRILPKSYMQSRKNSKLHTYSKVDFNWSKKIATFENKNKHGLIHNGNVKLLQDVVDPASLQLLVMSDLSKNIKRTSYSFVDNGIIKTYNITHGGFEIIQIGKRKINAYVITQASTGSVRKIKMWLDVDDHYLPVKIIQFKNDKEVLKMQLIDVKR
ncbi:hypothetical protein AwWohl_08200 [Gammaproteobacteria bacterium]|nr:hypothetical protein AwWohl_08200 [Gammaproteobacteria bacterium]